MVYGTPSHTNTHICTRFLFQPPKMVNITLMRCALSALMHSYIVFYPDNRNRYIK